MTVGELASHNHGASSNSTGGHNHYVFSNTYSETDGLSSSNYAAYNGNKDKTTYLYKILSTSSAANIGNTSYASGHSHTITVNNNGSGTAHNNLPPYLGLYVWKRTA